MNKIKISSNADDDSTATFKGRRGLSCFYKSMRLAYNSNDDERLYGGIEAILMSFEKFVHRLLQKFVDVFL